MAKNTKKTLTTLVREAGSALLRGEALALDLHSLVLAALCGLPELTFTDGKLTGIKPREIAWYEQAFWAMLKKDGVELAVNEKGDPLGYKTVLRRTDGTVKGPQKEAAAYFNRFQAAIRTAKYNGAVLVVKKEKNSTNPTETNGKVDVIERTDLFKIFTNLWHAMPEQARTEAAHAHLAEVAALAGLAGLELAKFDKAA